jgi:hypothetical protein
MSDLLAEIKRLQTEIALEHQQMESLPDAPPTTAPSSPLRDSASAKKPAPTASAPTAGTRDDYESMQHGFQERKQAADAIMTKVPPYTGPTRPLTAQIALAALGSTQKAPFGAHQLIPDRGRVSKDADDEAKGVVWADRGAREQCSGARFAGVRLIGRAKMYTFA